MSNKFVEFAQAVGTDVKELKNGKADKTEVSALTEQVRGVYTQVESFVTGGMVNQISNIIKTEVKSEILGEGVPEQLDTLKEISDFITQMNSNAETGVVQKLTELGQRIDTINNLDLLATYNAAKGA